MKWSFANVGILIFGFFGIFAITFFNELTVSNEQDYYTLKDAVEASMIESVDVTYFRLTGSIKINQEKFVENFTRRFTEVATYGEGNYNLEFYDISESPPKVSVRITDATNSYNIFGTFGSDPTQVNIVNEITAILDVYKENGEEEEDNTLILIVSADNLKSVKVINISEKVYEYDGKYYKLPDGDTLPVDDEECTLYSDRIVCHDDAGNEVVLDKIPDDETLIFEEDITVDENDDTTGNENTADDEEEKQEEYIAVSKKTLPTLNAGTGSFNNLSLKPKYNFYLSYGGKNYFVASGNVSSFDINKCTLEGNQIKCGSVLFSSNDIDCCYSSDVGWFIIKQNYCNVNSIPFVACQYSMCINEYKNNTLIIASSATSIEYQPKTEYATRDTSGICN